jgi:hypothetical protein
VPCRLRTGEEVRECPYSEHTACTVEMAPVAKGASSRLGTLGLCVSMCVCVRVSMCVYV